MRQSDRGRALAIFKSLFSFDPANSTGQFPYIGITLDAGGNLFTAPGNSGFPGGTVLELAWNGSAYAATPSVLALIPDSTVDGLRLDGYGNLFGISDIDAASGYGAVFEIPWDGSGYGSAVTLASFTASTGQYPYGAPYIDRLGNVLGLTSDGGANGAGTVFEIPKGVGGYASTPVTLGDLGGALGGAPQAGLIADAQGNLFGITQFGSNGPTLFEVPLSGSAYGGPVALASLDAATGSAVFSALAMDAQGNLFGVARDGGAGSVGSIFELVKTGGGYASTPTLLYSFDYTLGALPSGQLLVDADGNLFGTAAAGSISIPGHGQAPGEVFELAHTGAGYAASPTVLYNFDYTNGSDPNAGLTADAGGNLYGTTVGGGASGNGTAFEISGSGFAVGALGISGTVAAQYVTGGAAVHPFAAVTLADANPGQTETVTITQFNLAAGTLSDAFAPQDGFTMAGGVATLTGSAAQVTQALRGLSFAASAANPGTGFSIAVHDTLGLTASDSTTSVHCFGAGTAIATPDGARAVETLRAGDLVLTASGEALPVRWLGVQTIAARFADPAKAWPVRVAAGALGQGLPVRDLILSPGHALFIGGLLIQAGALAGRPGIARIAPQAEIFHYYHVELATHALLLAEGAAAESYLPTPEDLPFDNRAERVWADVEALPYPRVKAARQVPARWRAAA